MGVHIIPSLNCSVVLLGARCLSSLAHNPQQLYFEKDEGEHEGSRRKKKGKGRDIAILVSHKVKWIRPKGKKNKVWKKTSRRKKRSESSARAASQREGREEGEGDTSPWQPLLRPTEQFGLFYFVPSIISFPLSRNLEVPPSPRFEGRAGVQCSAERRWWTPNEPYASSVCWAQSQACPPHLVTPGPTDPQIPAVASLSVLLFSFEDLTLLGGVSSLTSIGTAQLLEMAQDRSEK